MLILANGAFACGNDWQHRIAEQLIVAEPPPDEFQATGWRAPSFEAGLLSQFMSTRQHVERNFLARNHVRDPHIRKLLLDDPYVRVMTISRDLREVVVQAYEHDRKRGASTGSLEAYYWDRGRGRVLGVLEHHRLWNTGSVAVFVGSYERLCLNFVAEVKAMASFLGVSASNEQIEAIRRSTASLGADASGLPAPGVASDARTGLSDAILEDLDRLVAGDG